MNARRVCTAFCSFPLWISASEPSSKATRLSWIPCGSGRLTSSGVRYSATTLADAVPVHPHLAARERVDDQLTGRTAGQQDRRGQTEGAQVAGEVDGVHLA